MQRELLALSIAAILIVGLPTSTPAEPAPSSDDPSFPVLLGTYSTTLIGSIPARTDNIRLAARALDGVVLDPGQVLSFNRKVGPRSIERGYQQAPVILHELRDLQVGGGVCQVASTLWNAALLAGLRGLERHRHSFPVDYVPLAQDATIVWGAKDLKVVNSLDQRVRVRLEVLGSTLTARFEGEEPIVGEFELETVEVPTPETGDGGAPGTEAELYRVHRVDGEETERELIHRDVYPPALARQSGIESR